MVGMEGSDSQYNVTGKLLGPGGSYIQHIGNTSGAKIVLRGIGSGCMEGPQQREVNEPLHFLISGNVKQQIDQAKNLCENLLSHVRQEYYSYVQQKNAQQYYGAYAQQYQGYYGGYPGAAPGYGAPAPGAYGGYQYPGMGYPGAAPPPAPYGYYPGEVPGAPGQEAGDPQQQHQQPPHPYGAPSYGAPAPPPGEQAPVAPAETPKEPPRRFTEAKESAPAPVPATSSTPAADDYFKQFYSEIGSSTATNVPAKSSTPVAKTASQEKTNVIVRSPAPETVKTTVAKLVPYSDGDETQDKKLEEKLVSKVPFWAAPGGSSEGENPLKERDKALKDLDKLEDDFYSELGIKK